MTNDKKPSFMDRGTILAFLVILIFWFGWQKWMEKTYPTPPAAVAATGDSAAVPTPNNPDGKPTAKTDPSAPTASKDAAASGNVSPLTETVEHYSQAGLSFDISSAGMGLKNIQLKDYSSRDGKTIQLSGVERDPSFATRVAPYDQPLSFAVTKKDTNVYVGVAHVGATTIEKTLKINPETFSFDTQIHVTGISPEFKGLATRLSDEMTEPVEKAHFFDATPDFHSWFVLHDGGSKTRHNLKRKNGPVGPEDVNALDQANATVAALSVHYFTMAIADHSSIEPKFVSHVPYNATTATGQLVYEPQTMPQEMTISYTSFAGPKSFTLLQSIDENLTGIIDYGMFSVIARPILWLLKAIHSTIPNWGWAIIILTIIVRLIVMPFNIFSYKSMKKMQVIQPQMNAIRERYKDKSNEEKLQMNQEIMQLMKKSGANPIGGCLPMLLQLPVFIALYAVLGQSIELYQAPFILWIHDLSVRDPLFVTPVLMGITMFIQQKITPSNMDPQQAKVMMWMPVIFAFFMISLPSGLTLYIFISTLFGIIQQFLFLRDRKSPTNVQAAKA